MKERFVIGAIRPNATLPPIYITCLHLNHVAEPTRLSGMTTRVSVISDVMSPTHGWLPIAPLIDISKDPRSNLSLEPTEILFLKNK